VHVLDAAGLRLVAEHLGQALARRPA